MQAQHAAGVVVAAVAARPPMHSLAACLPAATTAGGPAGEDALGASWREALYKAGAAARKQNAGLYRDTPLLAAAEAEEEARQEAARVWQQRAAAVVAAAATQP